MVFLDRHDSCLHEVHIPVDEKGEKNIEQNTKEAVIIVLKETKRVMGK